ncbi:MAG: transposase [Candidatus Nomurabacteria bacterium]|nr:transposase [Candidatus Nomurabacteria bacterium]
MNNRDYKKFNAGSIAHIYNRGNNKEKIFFDDQDYKAFLFRLALALGFDQKELRGEKLLSMPYSRIRIKSEGKSKFKINAFCLMPNHFHFLIEQCGDISISKLISRVCSSYSKYINNKYGRVGHAFQDCFKAVLIENNPQLMWTSAYIHMNPVKDKIVKHPSEYLWSSYNDYASDRNLPIINKELLIGTFGDINNFKKQTLIYDVKDGL